MINKAGKHIGLRGLAVILTLALAGAMFLGASVTSFAAGTFTDLNGSYYEEDVENLVNLGIINGYPDKTFKAENSITRAEVCTVVTKAMSPGIEKMADAVDSGFPDLKTSTLWAANYINYATAMGVINGYPDKTFKASNNVTYNELSAMIIRGMGIKESDLTGKWPENYKTKAMSLGIYDKVLAIRTPAQQASFNYNAQATRGDTVLMISAVLDDLKAQGRKLLPKGKSRTHVYEDGRYPWINGDAEPLSVKKAVDIMQTEGVLADAAVKNKAADEVLLATYEETAKNLRSIVDLLDRLENIKNNLKQGSFPTAQELTDITSNLRTVIKALLSQSEAAGSQMSLSSLSSLSKLSFDDIWPENLQITGPLDLLNRINTLWNKSRVDLSDLRSELVFYAELAEAQRDFCKNNLEANYQAEMNSIESQTVALYYGVLQAIENLFVSEDNLDVQNQIMDNVNIRYNVGTAAQIEVKSQKAAVISAEQSVKDARAMVEKALMNFNLLMGRDVTDNYTFTTELTPLPFPDRTLQEYIQAAYENRLTYKQVVFGLDMAKKALENAGKKSVDSAEYKQLEEACKSLEYAKNTLEKSIEIEVKSAYLDLMNKRDAITNAASTLNLAKDAVKTKQVAYRLGATTLSDVQQSQVVVAQTNQLIMSKTAEYNIAVYEFSYITGIGKERINFQQQQN